MTEIIFCKTRHLYDSYHDFWALVSLSNFKICYVDEIDISQDAIYIVTPCNGEWRPHINNENKLVHEGKKNIAAHLILWNLERPSGSAGSIGRYALSNRLLQYGFWDETGSKKHLNDQGETEISYGRFVDEVWVSDRQLAIETSHATRFVVLGSDKGLGEPGDEKKYRFCHMSYANGRRQSVLKHFSDSDSAQGNSFWPWDEAENKEKYSSRRDEVLKQSRFALNIHQDQHPFQEPLRFALFAAYGIPTLSESILDAYPWLPDENIIFSHYDGLLAKLNQMSANDYDKWRGMGLRAREKMCGEFQFGKMVRQAVEESVGLQRWR